MFFFRKPTTENVSSPITQNNTEATNSHRSSKANIKRCMFSCYSRNATTGACSELLKDAGANNEQGRTRSYSRNATTGACSELLKDAGAKNEQGRTRSYPRNATTGAFRELVVNDINLSENKDVYQMTEPTNTIPDLRKDAGASSSLQCSYASGACSDYGYLDHIEYADTRKYIPNITSGKVVKVYDADTITIANRVSVGNSHTEEIYRFQVRLNGIDTPEIKSKNATTKTLAIKARDVLAEMILGKVVVLRNVDFEKYGRLLADVYFGDIHINQWLLDNKYAVKYDGGTKNIPEEWEA
jgi:endonuclease YncB( thermonuclease family)